MATLPQRAFADLSQYTPDKVAVRAALARQNNPLDAILGGIQQGVALQQLPGQIRQLQQDALNKQLASVLKEAVTRQAMAQTGIFSPTPGYQDRPVSVPAIPLEESIAGEIMKQQRAAEAGQDVAIDPDQINSIFGTPVALGQGGVFDPYTQRVKAAEASRAAIAQKAAETAAEARAKQPFEIEKIETRESAKAKGTDAGKLTDVQKMSYAQANKFNSEPEVRYYVQSLGAIKGMEEIAKNPKATASDDIALIYSFMKILDPRSTVLASEYATAQNAAGVPDQVRQLFNRAIDGTKLTPERRKQYVATARTRAKGSEHSYNLVRKRYLEGARQGGLIEDIVVSGLPYPEASPEEAVAEAAAIDQTQLYTPSQAAAAAEAGDLQPGDVYFDTQVGERRIWE